MIVIIFIFFIKCFFRKKLKRINARLIKSRSKDIYIFVLISTLPFHPKNCVLLFKLINSFCSSTEGYLILISYSLDLAEKLEPRSEEHTSELQSHSDLVCRLLLEQKKPAGFRTARAADRRRPQAVVGRERRA